MWVTFVVKALWWCASGRIYCSTACKNLYHSIQDMLHDFEGGPQRLQGLPMLAITVTDGHHSHQVPQVNDIVEDALMLIDGFFDPVLKLLRDPQRPNSFRWYNLYQCWAYGLWLRWENNNVKTLTMYLVPEAGPIDVRVCLPATPMS